MKFTWFKFDKEWNWIFIIPSISLYINDMRIRDKSIRLCFDWLLVLFNIQYRFA